MEYQNAVLRTTSRRSAGSKPRFSWALVGALAGLLSAPGHAAFDTRITGGLSAAISSNIPGESHFDDKRFNLPDLTSHGRGLSAGWSAFATGDYNFPDQYATRCVRNDGATPCNGTEGPGESGLLYTTPDTYIRRSGGQAFAQATAVVDNGVLRVTARANSGGPIQITAPIPGNEDRLYSRNLANKGATASVSADLHTSNTVLGVGGGVGVIGHATISGHIDGGIAGNGVQPVDLDPSNVLPASRAGARFSFSATNWIPGYACGQFGCPAKNFSATFGAETDATNNGNFMIPFTLTVDVINGFKLETFSSLSAYSSGVALASFGNTARIDSIAMSDGFAFDTSDGTLARSGNIYTFVPTLAPVPEPSIALLMSGGLLLGGWRWRQAVAKSGRSVKTETDRNRPIRTSPCRYLLPTYFQEVSNDLPTTGHFSLPVE